MRIKTLHDMRLRSKLLVAYLGLSIAILTCGGMGALHLIKRAVKSNIENDLRNGTHSLINLIETTAQASIKNYLRAVAERNLEIARLAYKRYQDGQLTEAEARREIRTIFLNQTIGRTGYIYCINSHGVATVHPNAEVEGNNWAHFEFVRRQTRLKTGYIEYQWQNPGESAARPKALYMTYFEPYDWIISVTTYREEFKVLLPMEEIRQSVKDLKYGDSGYAFVTDRTGNVIIHPELEGRNIIDLDEREALYLKTMLTQQSGKITYWWKNPADDEAREKFAMFDYIPEFHWVVGATGYVDEIYAPIRSARNIAVIFIGAAVLLSAILTLFVSDWITRRLRHLMSVIVRGDQGDLTVRVVPGAEDEIGRLGRIYNAFLERLKSYHEQLTAEISQHRATASSLQKERDFNTLVLSTVEALVLVLDREARIVSFNRACRQCSGYTLAEVIGTRQDERLIPQEETEGVKAFLDGFILRPGEHRYVNHWITKAGRRRLIQWSNAIVPGSDGGVEFIVCAGLDITDQKATELALRHSETQFEAVFNQTYQFIGILAPDGAIRHVNQSALDFAGVKEADLIGQKFWEAPYWQHSEAIQAKVKQAVEQAARGRFERMEVNHVRFDGELRHVDFSIKPVRDDTGKVFMLIPEGRDITDRKKSEEVLRLSEEKYRILVENAHDAIFIFQNGVLQYANPSTEKLIGYSAAKLNNTPFADHIHPEDRARVIGRHQKRFNGRNDHNFQSFRIRGRSGAIKWIEANAIRIEWEGQPAVICFARDMTSQKQMESQLLHSQKMEAIGTLAGGIAHDFNNTLQVITGYTQLLQMDRSVSPKGRDKLATIQHACDHASELTRQLLTFSRKIESQLAPIDLSAKLRSVIKLLKGTLPRMIEIDTHLAEDLRIVEADHTQFEQIIMNLGLNAKHAMPDGGRLTIETRNVDLDDGYCRRHLGAVPGPCVMLSVSDTGVGMDAKTREHIFEPFYTTRETGSGTGLGLAMVYGIVKSHNGYITCKSEPGQGTTFEIYFPAAEKPAAGKKFSEDQKEITGGHEYVMIVDDDTVIRQLGREILESYGYRVCEANDGEKALFVYRQLGSKIDLIILDLNMPGMGGVRCLEEIKAIDPEMPVLIASGYSPHGQARAVLDNLAQGMLSKPYEIEKMLGLLRETLDRRG